MRDKTRIKQAFSNGVRSCCDDSSRSVRSHKHRYKSAHTTMSYKNNAASNKEFLFSAGGSKKKTSSVPTPSEPSAGPKPASSKGYDYGKAKVNVTKLGLSGEAKVAKIKEAEDYRDKAKKAMQKGLFSKPDPLAASTYYKRSADAYQLAGETRLERMYRMNSADCQKRVGAWATAAAEYTRAAELVREADDETTEMKREIGRKLHLDAAEAWRQMGDPGRAATSTVQAAMALMWDDESGFLSKTALEAIEIAVESFVPDPLNPYCRYRQSGCSAYIDPHSEETAENPSPEALELAKTHLVTRAYAHEPLQDVLHLLVEFSEYASALYTAGAITVLLEGNGVSTLSLSRAFVAETIITLAMGDPIAAEENFLRRHVQKSSYLTSRECKLAEELFRAVKRRDSEALEEARDVKGANRSGIGNLSPSLKELLSIIRLSGVARKGDAELFTTKPKKEKRLKSSGDECRAEVGEKKEGTALEQLAAATTGDENEKRDTDALQDELDALDFGNEESDVDDDDVDLR
jgi:Soluble NSF attachment protein, SNAP